MQLNNETLRPLDLNNSTSTTLDTVEPVSPSPYAVDKDPYSSSHTTDVALSEEEVAALTGVDNGEETNNINDEVEETTISPEEAREEETFNNKDAQDSRDSGLPIKSPKHLSSIPLVEIDLTEFELDYDFSSLDTRVKECSYVGATAEILAYADKREMELAVTLPTTAYGVHEHLLSESTTHEILSIDGIDFYSNLKATTDKERLNLLVSDIVEALKSRGVYSSPMIIKQPIKGMPAEYRINTLLVNTYEYNVLVTLCKKIPNCQCSLRLLDNETHLVIQGSDSIGHGFGVRS